MSFKSNLQGKQTITPSERTNMLLEQDKMFTEYDKKSVFYIICAEKKGIIDIVKFGVTIDIKTRFRQHQDTYGDDNDIILCKVIRTKNKDEGEKIEQKIREKNMRCIKREYDGKPRDELIEISQDYTIKQFINDVENIDNPSHKPNYNIKPSQSDVTIRVRRTPLPRTVKHNS